MKKKMLPTKATKAKVRTPQINMQSVLPKTLYGTLHCQWVRCGRANCRCAQGRLHGPYYYHFFRENGRLKKKYVKQLDVTAVASACLARRVEEKRILEAKRGVKRQEQEARAEWRDLLVLLRQLERGEI